MLYREAHQLIEGVAEARELGPIQRLSTLLCGIELLVIDNLFLRKLTANASDELAGR